MDSDDDGLYDSLPEICGLPLSSSSDELTESSMGGEEEVLRLPFCSKESTLTEAPESPTSQFRKKVSELRSTGKCICGDSLQWAWESSDNCTYVELDNNNRDVKFHKNHSSGTAMVRCTEPMSDGQYYWEVKITHPVYGTDVMLGVGTPEVEVKDWENEFVSLLGNDNKTWGLSYTGLFQHNGICESYTQCFRQGDIIGVHLDLWRGTLSFYKDRKNLGIATTGLRGKTLYAMASSTAAYSGMRLIRSCSFPSSLQFLCCYKLRELIPAEKNVLDVLNLPPGLRHYLKRKLNWLLSERRFDGSDICSIPHGDIANEYAMGSVIYVDDTPCEPLYGTVLFRNLNRFQGRGTVRDSGSSELPSENAWKKFRKSGSDSD